MKLTKKSNVEKAAEIISGYCSKHTVCVDGCMFFDKRSEECFFEKGALPCDWKEEKGGNLICLTGKD